MQAMKTRALWLLLAASMFACTASIAEDERQNTGPGNPAAIYCTAQGYMSRLEGGSCVFPDSTSCEQFAFYRGQCGQQFSFCAKRGGLVSSETSTVGQATFVNAYCTLNGVKCKEQDFLRSGICK
jgi:putative hemolysin